VGENQNKSTEHGGELGRVSKRESVRNEEKKDVFAINTPRGAVINRISILGKGVLGRKHRGGFIGQGTQKEKGRNQRGDIVDMNLGKKKEIQKKGGDSGGGAQKRWSGGGRKGENAKTFWEGWEKKQEGDRKRKRAATGS